MGGPGGSMWHPFHCPEVNSGRDLIKFFEKCIKSIETRPPSLKIDGVNLSFRLQQAPGTKYGVEFVVDRGASSGAMGQLDINGITCENAGARFIDKRNPGKPHGMIKATCILLDIFNRALPDIMPELKKIGMLDKKNQGATGLYFNTEFVLDTMNIKSYPISFIAIHGVRKFFWKTERKRSFVDVEVDQQTLDAIAQKTEKYLSKHVNRVFSSIPTSLKLPVSLNKALNTNFIVVYDSEIKDAEEPGEYGAGTGSQKTLRQWLADVKRNPKNSTVTITDEMKAKYPKMAKNQTAFAKNIYVEILRGTAVNKIVSKREDIQSIVDAAVMWESTRVFGNYVLDALESVEFGPANEEEGVVVRDPDVCGAVGFKIVGDFIIDGLASPHGGRLVAEQSLPGVKNEELPEKSKVVKKNFVILLPGGFKPPTGGHHHMIRYYDKNPNVSKVYVITGPGDLDKKTNKYIGRSGVTLEQSMQIFDIYGGFSSKVEFLVVDPKDEKSLGSSPMGMAYKLLEDREFTDRHKNALFCMGASAKTNDKGVPDSSRIDHFVNYFENNPEKLAPGAEVAFFRPAAAVSVGGRTLSASTMIKAFREQNWELFKQHLPHESAYDDVVKVLMRNQNLEEGFFSLGSIFSLVEEVMLQENNCLDHKSNKTFKSKSKCIQKQKGWARKRADSYVASVERKRGHIPEEIEKNNIIIKEQGASEEDLRNSVKVFLSNWISAKAAAEGDMDSITDEVTNVIMSSLEKSKEAPDEVTAESAASGGGMAGFGAPLGNEEEMGVRK